MLCAIKMVERPGRRPASDARPHFNDMSTGSGQASTAAIDATTRLRRVRQPHTLRAFLPLPVRSSWPPTAPPCGCTGSMTGTIVPEGCIMYTGPCSAGA